jgi:transposase-like protein
MASKKPITQQLNIEDICTSILNGQMIAEIAREYGVSKAHLTTWLSSDPDRSARAREARVAATQAYEEKAFELLSDAADPFELAKARELAQHLRWRASKINPKEYGDKQSLDVNGKLDVTLFDPEQAMEMAKLAYESKSR